MALSLGEGCNPLHSGSLSAFCRSLDGLQPQQDAGEEGFSAKEAFAPASH